ncbi:MAG: DUF3822 family protein [Bacteroidales bacterium]
MTTLSHPLFTRFDDSFSVHLSRNYNLFILAGRDRFSYCFSRVEDNCLIGLESYSFSISDPQLSSENDSREWCREVTQLLENLDELKKPFHKVRIAVEYHKSTFIPQELFTEGDEKELLLFNHAVEEFEICRHEAVASVNAEIIYTLPSCIYSTLLSFFPEAEISHASGQMLENLLMISKEPAGNGMLYANVGGGRVELISIEKGKLRYLNNFQYRTREDLAYYIIFVMEQLGLNPDAITLVLIGSIERESERFELLYRYIRNISFIDQALINASNQMAANFPVPIYYNLLSFAKCV